MSARLITLFASSLLFGGCDGRGQATPSAAPIAPTSATTATVSAHAPSAVSAGPGVSSAAPAPVAPPAALLVPATQIFEPSDLAPGERRPLLIFLHGLGASGKTAFDVLHLAAFGARERVFVIAPDGNLDR